MVDSRDPKGRYCGMREDGTSAVEESKKDDRVGFCDPNCSHCLIFPHYVLDSNKIWTCAPDNDLYMDFLENGVQ